MDTSLSEAELEALEVERADRSYFMQDVLLNTLMINADDDDPKDAAGVSADKVENTKSVRERASPMQQSSPSSQQQQQQQQTQQQQSSQNAVNQSTDRPAIAAKTEQQPAGKQQRTTQQRTSPTTQRTANQQLSIAPQSRIEFTISRPHQPSSGNINVREVLVGNNNYASTDTARRKPICTVDSINQTTEPPTSH